MCDFWLCGHVESMCDEEKCFVVGIVWSEENHEPERWFAEICFNGDDFTVLRGRQIPVLFWYGYNCRLRWQ